MKNIFSIALIILCFNLNTQGQKKYEQPTQVIITDWNEIGLFLNPQVYIENKDSIVSQIGDVEFEKLKEFGNNGGWPDSIAYDFKKRKDSLYMKHYRDQLSRLKMFKIASYIQVLNGQKHERHAIIRVPYNKNTNWNKNVKWDTIYFVIKESFIQPVN